MNYNIKSFILFREEKFKLYFIFYYRNELDGIWELCGAETRHRKGGFTNYQEDKHENRKWVFNFMP